LARIQTEQPQKGVQPFPFPAISFPSLLALLISKQVLLSDHDYAGGVLAPITDGWSCTLLIIPISPSRPRQPTNSASSTSQVSHCGLFFVFLSLSSSSFFVFWSSGCSILATPLPPPPPPLLFSPQTQNDSDHTSHAPTLIVSSSSRSLDPCPANRTGSVASHQHTQPTASQAVSPVLPPRP
jgi:hypothetical protein